jgi:hypothetical protein
MVLPRHNSNVFLDLSSISLFVLDFYVLIKIIYQVFRPIQHSGSLRRESEDKLSWSPFKRGLFDVRSFYNVLISRESNPFLRGVFGGVMFL